jgi:hypothetical protein
MKTGTKSTKLWMFWHIFQFYLALLQVHLFPSFSDTFIETLIRVVFFVTEPIYLMSRFSVGATHPCTPGTLPVPRSWLSKIDSFLPVAYRYDGLSV